MSSRGSQRGIRRGNPVVEPKQGRRGGNSSASTSNVSRYYRSMTLIDFLKNGPLRFNGNANALEADQWFREVERFLYTQHVLEVQSVEIVTYMLEEDAQNWWRELCHTSQLKQKDMSVADYTREFDNLCRFSKTCQGNPADYEEWKCAQYEKGLRRDIFNYVYLQKLTSFTELVKKSQLAEDRSLKWTLLQEGFGETAQEEPHRAGLRMYFRCGAPGHMSRNCPRGRAADAGWPRQY
ncbi:uncharacterized protein LOC107614983 [Arachis ipaensis]|uniref:uncharacterized protein LOC107614983 n=1 Tax=Arachis ipaensis TaxID=130454 RepID=UPI0007AF9F8B|nr:uncharacterized protein LOC107614983 [Arachis ipaensis]